MKAFVELVASLLSASISNPSSQDGASPPGLAGEMLRVMKEAGVLKGLTNALKLVDTDHPQVSQAPRVYLCTAHLTKLSCISPFALCVRVGLSVMSTYYAVAIGCQCCGLQSGW